MSTPKSPQQPASVRQVAFDGETESLTGDFQTNHSAPMPPGRVQGDINFHPNDSAADVPPGLTGYALHGRNGITAEYIYTGETFNNMRGGIRTKDATMYTGRFDLMLGLELDKMGLAPGGMVFFHFQQLHGEGITDRFAGAEQRISNIDGNPGAGYYITQLSQYWYERGFLDGQITFRLGKILCDSEFALATLGGDFINTSFGWTHTIPMPAYPNPSAGVIGFFELTDWLEFKAGLWDGEPKGTNWGFSGTGDLFSIYELKAEWALWGGSLPGDSNVGVWYHNGQFDSAPGGSTFEGSSGVYWGMSQMLSRENPYDEDDSQGMGAFVQFGWEPGHRSVKQQYWGGDLNITEQYWGLGVVYQGLVDSRDNDTCGLAVGNMTFTDAGPSRHDETVVELFYKARLGPHVVIQPDLQYIANPSGVHRDAFVFGLRFQTVL